MRIHDMPFSDSDLATPLMERDNVGNVGSALPTTIAKRLQCPPDALFLLLCIGSVLGIPIGSFIFPDIQYTFTLVTKYGLTTLQVVAFLP
mmetsp:Transcript_9963/g.27908  ORF Transcript_9963/g.27908 Transcript_9963/m.27908 type:complete len:90 (-) Transcript_9963:365-634(-)